MSHAGRPSEEAAAERGAGRPSLDADDDAQQREQGPEGDDPLRGVLPDDDDLSVRDRDLVEPGLVEADLGALELGDVAEEGAVGFDESGTESGDESSAAAEDLTEDTNLVAGSEPVELPGTTDDLFPQEEDARPVEDGGEEGLPDDLADALDDHVRSDDAAWRQSGPPDETDALGGDFEFPAAPAGTLPSSNVPIRRIETAAPAVALASRDGSLAALVGFSNADSDLRLEFLEPPGAPCAAPPLRFGDEPQGVTGLAACGTAWLAATDRGMVFVARPGDPEWLVADRYAGRHGTAQSWLPLGMSRRPFHVLGSRVVPGRAWAWRPGGPLLRWDAREGWVLEDEAQALRVLLEDAPFGRTLAGMADEDGAALRTFEADRPAGLWPLPGDATDVLLAPGACAAACGGTVWLGCRDPELPLLRGEPGTGSWTPIAGVRVVRLLAALPDGAGALAVCTHASDETDELVRIASPRDPPRLLVRARDLAKEASPGAAAGSRGRIDQVLVDETGATAWIRSAGCVYAVGTGGSGT